MIRRDGLSSWRVIFYVPVGMLSGQWSANFLYDGGRTINVFDEFTCSDSFVAFFEIISSHVDQDTPSFVEIHCPNHCKMCAQSLGGLDHVVKFMKKSTFPGS